MCGGGKSSARWFGKPDTSGWEIYPNTFERRKSWSILNGRLRVFQTARASCLTNITKGRRLLSMLTQLMLAFYVFTSIAISRVLNAHYWQCGDGN